MATWLHTLICTSLLVGAVHADDAPPSGGPPGATPPSESSPTDAASTPQPYPPQPYPPQPYPPPQQPLYEPPPAPLSTGSRWYGWKIALSDAGAVGLVLATAALSDPRPDDGDSFTLTGSDALVLIGLAWWGTATPLVHLTESNLVGGALSYGLRLGLPTIGALVGAKLDGPDSPDDTYAIGGILVGVAAASVIDIAWVARRSTQRGSSWLPRLAVTNGGVELGLAGAF